MQQNFAIRPSQFPRNARTFALQMALDQERKQEIAVRLRELRGPTPQRVIADKVGVTIRAYQAWELAETNIHWENIEALAAVHGVSENYILYGSDERPHEITAQSERLEQAVSRLEAQVRLLRAESAERDAEVLRRISALSAPSPRPRRRPPA